MTKKILLLLSFICLFASFFWETKAYFYAQNVSFSSALTTSWSISYFTWATATNVSLYGTWQTYSTLNLWSWVSDTVILNNAWTQAVSQVFTERAYLSDCTLWSYNSTIRVWTWLFCPVWRVFSDTWSLWMPWNTWATWPQWPKWSTGATWWTWSQWISWLSAYDLALANGFSGSEVAWVMSLQGSWATVYITNTGISDTQYIATGSYLIASTQWQGNIYVTDSVIYILLTIWFVLLFTSWTLFGIIRWIANLININFSRK